MRRYRFDTTSATDMPAAIPQVVESATPAAAAEAFDLRALFRRISETGADTQHNAASESLPALTFEGIYPHLFDQTEGAGTAVALVRKARTNVDAALNALNDADLATVSSQVLEAAAHASKAHEHAGFNPSFGAVIGFIRRAALVADISDISRPGLNALSRVLLSLETNPALDLTDAVDLSESLSVEGWNGENDAVSQLVAALLDESQEEGEQSDLFDLPAAPRDGGTG